MKRHELKLVQPYFEDVWNRVKTFELRKNDRDFKVGDSVMLREYDSINQTFLNRYVYVTITYILKGGIYGLEKGYCIFGFKPY